MSANKPIYLTGLNGIRALAAIGVMVSHINLSLKFFEIETVGLFGLKENGGQSYWQLGAYGVTMFFALSGFLITFLLLKEIEKSNTIDIKKFYVRRILRIWPLYYVYTFLVTIALLGTEGTININLLLYYIFFLANVPFALGIGIPEIAHFWSISVEEQFYLFWPFIFLFIRKWREWLILILIVLQFGLRLVLIKFGASDFFVNLSTINRFDCMMIGGLFAILFYQKSNFLRIFNNMIVQVGAWIIVFAAVINKIDLMHFAIENFVFSIVTSTIIIGQVLRTYRVINLEVSPLTYLGKLSYGIYAYHPLIIYILIKSNIVQRIENDVVATLVAFISISGFTILAAHLSYILIEKKFLNLKSKFSIIRSTNEARLMKKGI